MIASAHVRIADLVVEMAVDAAFLDALEAEDLIHIERTPEGEGILSPEDAERVRVACTLVRELDVNLAGAEVILHMRETIRAMQRQFEEVLDALVAELRHRQGRL